MSSFNLPPGCSESDIPGNRPEDAKWEALIEDISASGLSADEARQRWESQPDLLALARFIVNCVPYSSRINPRDAEILRARALSAIAKADRRQA